MFTNLLHNRSKFARRLSGLAVAVAAVLMTTASVSANSSCFQVKGHYEEHFESNGCNSPVGFCIAGEYGGVIQGDFFGTATSFIPSGDTPTTNVVLFTSDSVIHAQVHGKQGDLIVKNAGAYQQAGEGNIVDLQIVTGGTGELAGASGAIRASGLFDPASGAGASDYDGMICLP